MTAKSATGTHNPVAVNEPIDCCLAALYRHTTLRRRFLQPQRHNEPDALA
jgi:hypothetical protein